jgi:acyl-[acyl carrier protein]--UDP-N-acetylglucosamine O-acyltransferase
MSNLILNDALEKVKEELGFSPYIQEMLDFISKSQRGICRPKK